MTTIHKRGFVALIDVLGFSERVSRNPPTGLDNYIDTVVGLTRDCPGLGSILFSDTVVLYTFDDGQEAFNLIATLSSELLFGLLMAEVPVRGAISRGEFFRSDREGQGTVLAGRPIIEAHHFESQLQWIGIMLTPSILESFPDIPRLAEFSRADGLVDSMDIFRCAYESLRVRRCQIPLESQRGYVENYDGCAIVPIASGAETLKSLSDSMGLAAEKLQRLKRIAPNTRSQLKYERSEKFITRVKADFDQLFRGRFV